MVTFLIPGVLIALFTHNYFLIKKQKKHEMREYSKKNPGLAKYSTNVNHTSTITPQRVSTHLIDRFLRLSQQPKNPNSYLNVPIPKTLYLPILLKSNISKRFSLNK